MARFLLILFLIMFCYKQVAEGITLNKVILYENFLCMEEGQLEPDEEKKSSEADQDDMIYLHFHQISLVKKNFLQASVESYSKPLSGYPILLFTPPNLK